MDVSAVQAVASVSPNSGTGAVLPRLAQSGFLANDPFAAYLLTLSDAASIAQAAITGQTGTQTAVNKPASNRQAQAAAAPPLAQAASVPAAASSLSAAGVLAYATALALGTAAPDTSAAAATGVPAAGSAAADTPAASVGSTANAEITADAVAAAATAVAPGAAETSPLEDAGSLATDATAKYLGGGILGLAGTISRDPAELDAIPAVSGVLATPALAANTYSNPQNRAFGQAVAQPSPLVAAAGQAGAPSLDLLG